MSTQPVAAANDVRGSKRAYEDWHARLDVDVHTDTPWHLMLFATIDPARDLAGKRVLEIACGRGGLASRLATLASPRPKLVAADFSFTAVAKGKEFAEQAPASRIGWPVADAQRLPFPSGTFDTVISCETIEHLPDPRQAVAEFHRVLRPGGRLLLTTPNYLGLMGLYRGYLRAVGRPYTEEGQPINRFMLLPQTRAWLSRAGFTVTAVQATGHYLPWPGRVPIRYEALDRWPLLKWLGLHSLLVAEKA